MKAPLKQLAQSSLFHLFSIPALAAVLSLPAAAAPSGTDPQSDAYQASLAQGDVQRNATVIRSQLLQLCDQMRQLMPNDVAAVDEAIRKVESLSQGEMNGAVKALQEAAGSKDAQGQLQKISAAIKSQGAISSGLNRLAVELMMRDTLAGIGNEISGLVRRQAAVNSEIKRIGKIQQAPVELRGNLEARYQLANGDQKGVTADLNLLGKRLDTLAKDITDDSKNGLVQAAAVANDSGLGASADRAAGLTSTGPFADADAAQMQVIRTLVAMEQALAGGNSLDRLRALADRLKRSSETERQVMDAVMLVGERQDLDRGFKMMQSDLSDEIVAVQYEVQPLNGQVADALTPAEDASGRAIENFRRMNEEHMDARANTRAALDHIDEAYRILAGQIAMMEKPAAGSLADLKALLDSLYEQVLQASKDQARDATTAETAGVQPALQAAMIKRVTGFQPRALPISPEAAETLGVVLGELPQTTARAQHGAADDLAKAAELLLKQSQLVASIMKTGEFIDNALADAKNANTDLDANDVPGAVPDLTDANTNTEAALDPTAMTDIPGVMDDIKNADDLLKAAMTNANAAKPGPAAANAKAATMALTKAANGLRTAAGQLPGIGMGGSMVSEMPEMTKTDSPNSRNNGGGGGSGDNLDGAGSSTTLQVLTDGAPYDTQVVTKLREKEKTPQEFAMQIQQYYKNLADGAGL